jgi:adsorption protein B
VRGIRHHEELSGEPYEIIQQHDAEDLIPRLALKRANQEIDRHGMIQFPVLPLKTPVRSLAHGTYCDEFAEFHLKELFVRSRLGGFIPSAGVGTAYRREVIERLAELNNGEPFDSRSLTEDYFVGLQVHKLGSSQLFVVPDGYFSGRCCMNQNRLPRNIGSQP